MTDDNPYKDGGAFTGDKYWPIAEAKIPILDSRFSIYTLFFDNSNFIKLLMII